MTKKINYLMIILLSFISISYAAGGDSHGYTMYLLIIPIILLFAKLGSLVEKIGQPSVLGELLAGVLLGNLALFGLHFYNFTDLLHDPIIPFLAELGVIILLFEIGLESNIAKMKEVGINAFIVAIIGVIAPFVGGFFVSQRLMPGQSINLYLFIGATLTATSVGITARVFKDLGRINTKEAQTVLGAAVIDDVLGLIILAIVTSIVKMGTVGLLDIGIITGKAIVFLVGSIIIGEKLAPYISKILSKINTGVGMKFTLIIIFCLLFSYLAGIMGLAPIVGAFAAGLILDPVFFKYFRDPKIVNDIRNEAKSFPENIKGKLEVIIQKHANRHIEQLIRPISYLLVPIFFVVTGINVNLSEFANWENLKLALILTLVAFIGKLLSGIGAKGMNKLLIGMSMVPRGEVGLIFAMSGMALGVIKEDTFSIIVIVVILTTLLTPPLITLLLKKQNN